MVLPFLVSSSVVVLSLLYIGVRTAWVVAEPDEWLLSVRNGVVRRAGVGISLWRLPGDVVARFSSTVQRVRFTVDARSAEHLAIRVDGFILWSIQPDPVLAFRAFSKLGIVDTNRHPSALRSRSHLLTSPQHRAFQALLAAEVRAHVGSLSLHELLTDPRSLPQGLADRFASLSSALGISIERTEVLEVQPADPRLMHDLAARSEEAIREEAETSRLEARERLREKTDAAKSREATVELETRLASVEAERQVAKQEGEALVQKQLADEAALLEVLTARRHREEVELTLSLDRARRTAEADRDAALARGVVEEQKSQPVRDLELAKLVAERTTAALGAWQIRDAKWVSVGDTSPVATIASLVAGVRELTGTARPT